MKKLFLAILFLLCLILTSSAQHEVTLCFTGDIMLDRDVSLYTDKYGMGYPYELVEDVLKGADITFANLECPLTDTGTPAKNYGILFKAQTVNAPALKNAGFDILNISNNHIMDYGTAGINETIRSLNDNDIEYTGISSEPTIIKSCGEKIGFLGYSEVFNDCDEDKIKAEIAKARKLCNFLVVSFHWGCEYNNYPTESQKKWAHIAVDCGADLIIGHHPHVLQGIEKYKGKYIFYSLGNFIFDRQVQDGTDESVILNVKIDENGANSIETIPVVIKSCRPEIVQGSEGERILEKLEFYSKGISRN